MVVLTVLPAEPVHSSLSRRNLSFGDVMTFLLSVVYICPHIGRVLLVDGTNRGAMQPFNPRVLRLHTPNAKAIIGPSTSSLVKFP